MGKSVYIGNAATKPIIRSICAVAGHTCRETCTPVEKNALQRQIDATDKEIDQLVYELYGLSDEETRIVEEAKSNP